jgi:hypothetical protein
MQTGKHVLLLPCFPVTNPHYTLPKWITERGKWPIKMKCSKETKSVPLKMKFELGVTGVIK